MGALHHWRRRIVDHVRWALVVMLPAGLSYVIPARRSLHDPGLDPAALHVIEAAGMLDVSEYQFLVLAYEEKFGRPPLPEEIDRIFGPYMYMGRTPSWAESVAREVIGLYETGQLATSRFRGKARPPPTLWDIAYAVIESVVMILVLGLIFFMFIAYEPLYIM